MRVRREVDLSFCIEESLGTIADGMVVDGVAETRYFDQSSYPFSPFKCLLPRLIRETVFSSHRRDLTSSFLKSVVVIIDRAAGEGGGWIAGTSSFSGDKSPKCGDEEPSAAEMYRFSRFARITSVANLSPITRIRRGC